MYKAMNVASFNRKLLFSLANTNMLMQFFSVITGVVIARYLGPDGRGEYAIIQIYLSIFTHVFLFGTHVHLARESAEGKFCEGEGLRYAQLYSILLGSIAVISLALISVCLSNYYSKNTVEYIILGSIAIPFGMFNIIYFHIALGAKQFNKYNFSKFVFTPTYLLLAIVLFLFADKKVEYLVLAYVLAAMVPVIITYYQDFNSSIKIIGKQYYKELLSTIKKSLPYGVIVLTQAVSIRVDQLVLSYSNTYIELGVYVVAFSLASLHASIGASLATYGFSISMDKGEEENIKTSNIKKYVHNVIFFYMFLTLVMIYVLPSLVTIIFGSAFVKAETIVVWLTPALSMMGVSNVIEEILKGKGIASPGYVTRLVYVVVIFLLFVFLFREDGEEGMAKAVMLASLLQFLLLMKYLQQEFKLKIVDFLRIDQNLLSVFIKKIRNGS